MSAARFNGVGVFFECISEGKLNAFRKDLYILYFYILWKPVAVKCLATHILQNILFCA